LTNHIYRLHQGQSTPTGNQKRRRRSSTHHASQQELSSCRQHTLQARRRIRNPREMRHSRRRKRNPTGSSRRHMWKPRGFTHAGWQSLQIRILLAHSIIRCRATRQTMPRMPVLRQTESLACSQLDNHTSIVAIRLLEP